MEPDIVLPEDMSWRSARIPKDDGTMRELTIPNDGLMALQRDVILPFLYNVRGLRARRWAHGFVPFRSPVTAVLAHRPEADIILKMDAHRFFDTFPAEPVETELRKAGVSERTTELIMRACVYGGHFPQGAPTSPYLTNIGMRGVDTKIASFARRNGFEYTRYADDFTFSKTFAYAPGSRRRYNAYMFRGVERILSETLGIHLNQRKSCVIRRYGSGVPRRVLGITIAQDGEGYNASIAGRRGTRAGLHNLACKIRGQKGWVHEDDKERWRELKGFVLWSDTVRSASRDEGRRGADPKYGEKDWDYLVETFKEVQGC